MYNEKVHPNIHDMKIIGVWTADVLKNSVTIFRAITKDPVEKKNLFPVHAAVGQALGGRRGSLTN